MKKILNKIRENLHYVYYLVFLVPFVIDPFGDKIYVVPKQAFMVTIISVFLFFWAIFNINRKWLFSFNKKILLVVGLWLISLALSTIFSVAPIESFWGSYDRMQGVITMFYYILHFFICLQIFKDEEKQEELINIVLVLGGLLSMHAILQYLKIDPLNLGDMDTASGRTYATIGQPNLLGQWLIIPFFAGWFLFFNIKKKITAKLLYLAPLILIITGMLTTLNRGSLIAIAITIPLIFFYQKKKKISKRVIAIGLLVFMTLAGTVIFMGTSRSLNTRSLLYEYSVPLLTKNPIVGSGLETYYQTFQYVFPKEIYQFESMYNIPDRVHSEIYQVVLDQGIFGLLLYVLIIIFLGWVFVRKKLKTNTSKTVFYGLVAILLSLQVSFSTESHMIVIMVLFGIILNASLNFKEMKIRGISFKVISLIMVMLFTLFSLNHAYSIIKTNRFITKGMESFFYDFEISYAYFQEASRITPHYGYINKTAIHFLSLPEKINALQEPKKKEILSTLHEMLGNLGRVTNHGFQYDLSAAKVFLAENNYGQAQLYFESAARKAPNNSSVYQDWGDAAFGNGDYETAIIKYEKLQALAPPYWLNEKFIEEGITDYVGKNRIFRKTHELFYYSMAELSLAYVMTGQEGKAVDLDNKWRNP